MTASIIISCILIYLIVIGLLIYGFDKVDTFIAQDVKPKTSFSIVIPFRNEALHLPKLLESISQLNYPDGLFEIILVNDASNDDSVGLIKSFKLNQSIKVIENKRLTNSPKKDAITSAIKEANNDWIVTTDADCILPKYWLDSFDEFIQTNTPNCVVGPVAYHGTTSTFKRFQALDFMSLQGATIGGFGLSRPFLCNGANFAYKKSKFIALNGFEGNTNIASGDDVFLLEKFRKLDAKKIAYLKSYNAIVRTYPVDNLSTLIEQRLRWASKTTHVDNTLTKFIGLIVTIGNLSCIALIPLLILNLITARIAMSLFIIKFAIDFLLLFKTARFLKQEKILGSYILSSIVYPFFSILIVLLTFFKPYNWKERQFKK